LQRRSLLALFSRVLIAASVVDCERGLLLRCEAFLGDALLMVEDMIEVFFDE
jgi:hypothetical protein